MRSPIALDLVLAVVAHGLGAVAVAAHLAGVALVAAEEDVVPEIAHGECLSSGPFPEERGDGCSPLRGSKLMAASSAGPPGGRRLFVLLAVR
jgi:hypothetical protein